MLHDTIHKSMGVLPRIFLILSYLLMTQKDSNDGTWTWFFFWKAMAVMIGENTA